MTAPAQLKCRSLGSLRSLGMTQAVPHPLIPSSSHFPPRPAHLPLPPLHPSPTSVDMDLKQRVQDSLSGTHTIERELGGGGMSRVFVASERRLGRQVVVKVLAPELAAAMSAERFEREIQLAASLQQANIVPVISAGDFDGLPYYTMPFVEGESLRTRLAG